MADKVIGRLTLDISDIDQKLKAVNKALSEVGAGVKVDLSKNVSAEVKKQLDGVLKEIKSYEAKMGEAVDKAISNAEQKAGKKVDTANLKEAIAAWKEYYTLMAKAENARNAGRFNQASYLQDEASKLIQNNKLLQEEADKYAAVAKAKRTYEAAIASGKDKQAAQDTRDQIKAHKELQKILEDSAKARERAQSVATNKSLVDEQQRLNTIIDLYRKKIELDIEATKAVASGNMDNANLFLGEEAKIQAVIDAVAKLYPELDKLAQADQRVADAELKRQAAMNNAKQKANDIDYKNRVDDINNYATALVNLYNEQAKLNNAVASGRIKEGSEEYQAATEKIQHLEEAAVEAGTKLDAAGVKAANGMNQVKMAADGLVQSQAKLSDAGQINYLDRAEKAYNQLTIAIRNYNTAKKAQDETHMNYWQDQINGSMAIINSIETEIDKLNLDADTRARILSLVEQAKTAHDGFTAGVSETAAKTTDLSSAVNGLVTRYMSLMAVIRMIKEVLGNMVEYVSAYYDKMNEIQIITGKSSVEVQKLGDTYRQIAEDMRVSSLDMADAAIYFTRQGLGAGEIEKRLKNVTMYAKTANVEFKDAAEIMTAVVNSMGLVEQEAEDGRNATQRVADVFLKIGDNAATSGQEIGEAMQKAAASAGAFGVSMEWLASYIATVSETTRQEARTIGTAFNTIIARLHQIKQTGYNSDDETKVNDIAKALANIDVVLMDQQGNWRDMEDILVDIADKWGELDGKTKSYIATTMAGVKQQNVFLALMNDMSKGVEDGSRAWELYSLAMDSAGTAEEKYGTYTDSVTAAQERLNVAEEKFYSLLQGDALKSWYNFLTTIVTGITNATKALKGMNLIIPVVIGLIVTLGVAMISAAQKATSLGVAMQTFTLSHPIVLGIMAVVTVFGLMSAAASGASDAAEDAYEKYSKASENLEKSQTNLKEAVSQQQRFNEMMEKYNEKGYLTNSELNTYNDLLEDLASISPAAKKAVDELRSGMADQADVAKVLNDELERTINIEKQISNKNLIDKLSSWEAPSDTSVIDNSNQNSYLKYWGQYLGKEDYTTDEAAYAMVLAYRDAYDQWENNIDGFRQFLNGVADVVNAGGSYFTDNDLLGYKRGAQYLLPNELFEELRTWSGGDAYGLNTRVEGGNKASDYERYLFTKYFGNPETIDAQKQQLIKEMNEMVAEVISVVGTDMNNIEQNILRNMLIKAVMGEDDELSSEEYQAMGKKMSMILADLMNNGFSMITMDPRVVLEGVGTDILGDFFDMYFSEEEIEAVASNPELVHRISEAYASLLSAGFSSNEIWSLYNDIAKYSLPLDQWANAVDLMRLSMINEMRRSFGSDFFLMKEMDLDTGVTEWTDLLQSLDIETIKLMRDMADAGVASDTFLDYWIQSGGDVEKFTQLLRESSEQVENETKSISEMVKEIKTFQKEVKTISGLIDDLKKGKDINLSDILDLAETHPQLLAVIHDAQALKTELENIIRLKGTQAVKDITDWMLGNEEVMANSPFADMVTEEVKTLGDIFKDPKYQEDVQNYIDKTIGMMLAATGDLEMVGKEWITSLMTGMFNNNNMDLDNRPVLDASELTKAGWKNAGDGIATLFSSTYTAGDKSKGAGLEWNQDVVVALTPITPDGKVLSPEELDAYMEKLLKENMDAEDLLGADMVENGGLGLVIDISYVADDQSFDDATSKMDGLMQFLHAVHEYLYGQDKSEKSWLQQNVEAAAAAAESEWAKSNNFVEQIDAMARAMDSEGGVEAAYQLWNKYDEAMRKSIADTYPDLAAAMYEVEKALKNTDGETDDLTTATNKLNNALSKSAKYATAKNFTGTYSAIQKLQKGTISASEAFETFNKELDKVTKANEEVADAQAKIAKGTELTANDVNNLASALNLSAQEVIDDFPGAVAMLDDLRKAGAEAFNELNKEATMRILGIGEADFTQLTNGMIAVQDTASATVQMLLALGQFKLEEREVKEGMTIPIIGKDGKLTKITATSTGKYQYLVPTNNNPLAKGLGSTSKNTNGGGGGGGGGDKNSNSGMTEVERMLDRMSQQNAIREYQQSFYNAQSGYYSETGQLQGVIAYSEREIELLKEQSKELDNNVARIEEYITKKKAELAQLSITDEAYEEVADDLDKLQKAHQEYTNQLIENKTSVESLTKAIKEQREKIRSMEIDLRNTILKAIEDREKRTEDMLKREIEMENTILDLITKRYEKERDEIIDSTQRRIDLLNDEKTLLSEQLQLRKEQADQEDKLVKLKELEVKYQRIVADPTRQKEALSIRKEIEDLRKEMAWDAAEKEVEAQQDALDQQINSLEDYITYVQEYYEDLFEHPTKLIEEMKSILTQTDEEIIEWLKKNDESYAKSTENTQNDMVKSWQKTLDDMHGIIKTYWDEVEQIIAQGDDYIIEFLKENSADYREAGKLQAEAYVDEWQKKLDDLKKAHEKVVADIAASYQTIEKADTSSSSKKSGGGGGGGKKDNQTTEDHGYSFVYGGKTYASTGFSSKDAANIAMQKAVNDILRVGAGTMASSSMIGQGIRLIQQQATVYKEGGLADFTGPAWLDGTPQNPERVLNPYQTQLFETMVKALEQMSRVTIPGMPNYSDLTGSGGNPISIGDIVVNVDNLDTDDDYEELAQKVSDILMERIGRTAVVGGMRINSI